MLKTCSSPRFLTHFDKNKPPDDQPYIYNSPYVPPHIAIHPSIHPIHLLMSFHVCHGFIFHYLIQTLTQCFILFQFGSSFIFQFIGYSLVHIDIPVIKFEFSHVFTSIIYFTFNFIWFLIWFYYSLIFSLLELHYHSISIHFEFRFHVYFISRSEYPAAVVGIYIIPYIPFRAPEGAC